MNSLLPRLKDVRTAAKDSQIHRWNRTRPSIGRVGKVFPKKEQVKEKLNEKLDLFCVGLEKEKDTNAVNLPALEQDASHKGSPDADNTMDICLPGLPSALGDRRHSSSSSSSTTPEPPPDFLIQGQSRASRSPQTLCVIPELPESEAVQTMRAELEPLLEELEEEDIFGTDDEPKSLKRILFVQKMGIYVEVRSRDYVPGIYCVPLFHCPRCLDHWTNLGRVPEKCRFKKQLTCGPEIVVNYRKHYQTTGEGNNGGTVHASTTGSTRRYSNKKHGASRPGDNNGHPSSPTGSADDVTPADRLGNLEDLENLSDESLMEILQRNLSHGRLLNGDEYSRKLAEVLGVGEDQYSDFARISKDLSPGGKDASYGSPGGQENPSNPLYETLNELKIHDLPSEMKTKLLKLLQAQRARKLRLMKEKGEQDKQEERVGNKSEQDGNRDQQGKLEELVDGTGALSCPRGTSRSRGERSSRGHKGSRDVGEGIGTLGMMEAWNDTEDHFVEDSSTDPLLLTMEDDINAWDNRNSADVLQYQELQKQRRAKKKNPAVWNKTGQPDTPRPRLGKHSMGVPSNSSSFAYNEDVDEEDWDLGRSPQSHGPSRARLSDSRNSMWRKYSSAASSSHSTSSREFSLTGFDDQGSRTASQLSALDDSRRDWKGGRGAKKEKTEAVKRPRTYHSKLVNDLQLDPGEARPLIGATPGQQHPTTRGSDNAEVTARERRVPSTLKFHVNHDSAGDLDDLRDNKAPSWVRPVSSSGPQQRQRSPDVSLPDIWRSCTPHQASLPRSRTPGLGRAEISGDISQDNAQLDKILAESPERTTPGDSIPSPIPTPTPTPKEKSSLVSLYDLRDFQRLPVTSAFSFSYYALPHQHKQMNKSIDVASKRIGRRRKGSVRSRSVP